MKKKLEADLISIAHRILQLKNKSDINQLYLESQKLYEKLSVLRFIDEHYGDVKPTIGHAEMEQEVQAFYDKDAELPAETVFEQTETVVPQEEKTEEKPVVEESVTPAAVPEVTVIHEEPAAPLEEPAAFEADIKEQPVTEEMPLSDIVVPKEEIFQAAPIEDEKVAPLNDFTADFSLETEPEALAPQQLEKVQISFEDLLGGNYSDTQFVKVDDVPALPPEIVFEAKEKIEVVIPEAMAAPEVKEIKKEEQKIVSLNDKLSKTLDIDLNDRIAFVKHLFGNNNEDYNRVLSQLITFGTFHETKDFIEEMVKPDYNNWEGKDDYADRFMDIIEKKFL